MPECCEIRTVADKLRPYLVSRMITNYHTGERAKATGFHHLKGPVEIIGVRSHGKKVLIDLSSGHLIVTSLGMTGRLCYQAGNHSHIRFDISDCEDKGGLRVMKFSFSLFFDDTRYMGGIDIISNAEIPTYFVNIGPDLLQHALDEKTWIPLDVWLRIFHEKKSKRKICDILMDQNLVAGIGNYLQAEILYFSGIHPRRPSNTLTIEEWDRVRINSHKVVLLSYSYGGFTIESFISPDGSLGMYPAVIYDKMFDPLGNLIIHEKATKAKGSRTIHFVPQVQH